jgi:hypothetical protein
LVSDLILCGGSRQLLLPLKLPHLSSSKSPNGLLSSGHRLLLRAHLLHSCELLLGFHSSTLAYGLLLCSRPLLCCLSGHKPHVLRGSSLSSHKRGLIGDVLPSSCIELSHGRIRTGSVDYSLLLRQ